MKKQKILILKNDRGGDLFTSIDLISSLLNKNNETTILLLKFNYGFNFLFKNAEIKKISFDLSLIEKIYIFFHILKKKYSEIYILTPKNYYFFLPLLFRNIKFYAITINGKKRNRPNSFLRKFLHKYKSVDRTKYNKKNLKQLQSDLITQNTNNAKNNLNIPKMNEEHLGLLPDKFLFFQFKKKFFDELSWSTNEFEKIINFLNVKNKYILFSSDFEISNYNKYFESKYSVLNFGNDTVQLINKKKNIFFLRNIDAKNLFLIIKKADKILCPHGLVTHISNFFEKNSVNMFSIKINNKSDYHHEKISFSGWYSNTGIKFIFLNNNINKAIRKISKFI